MSGSREFNDPVRVRRAFAEAVARMHQREAEAHIAAAWYEDHEALAEPEVMCPITCKWISRKEWEAECRREADLSKQRRGRTEPLKEIVLDDSPWSPRPTFNPRSNR